MRILMLIHSLRRGGAERVLLELTLGLQKRGHIVKVISWLEVNEYQEDCYKSINPYYLLPKNRYRWVRSIPDSAKLLKKAVENFKPDLIQIHTPNVALLAAWSNLNIPFIQVIHGYGDITRLKTIKNEFIRIIYRIATWKLNASFIAVSESLIPFIIHYFKINEIRITSVLNGVDPSKFIYVEKLPNDLPIIIMIGTLCDNKGQKLGLHAFKKILNLIPSAQFQIIGEGEDHNALEKLVNHFGIGTQVKFLGQQNNVAEILSKSHILLQLSKSEAMPMVAIEAMASGVPIVGFNVRGTRDVVLDKASGFLTTYGDIGSIADLTVNLLKDNTLYQKIANNARKRFEEFFSYECMVDGHETYIKNVIRRKQRNDKD
jgi:glycosyltransferase involved in cell wall biosynthesis